ncbi:MAG: T9SS type A sorting domain-containing protein, partial [Bacteroidales bacterium]|nr:T9SS type A sorting domain-containing protein [Bacteroidales bacterium]
YILTADHCGYESSTNDLNYWIFYFNYEAGTCNGTTPIYYNHTVTGCTLVAHDNYGSTNSGSDFFLVKLKNNVPQNYNPYYNGWSRYTTPISTSGVGIHHPDGDIKKISTYQNTLLYSVYSTHWRVSWVATANGHGITEGGSSGSPLFNSSGKIIGTLTSGTTSCDNLNGSDYYGKFSYHWASNGSTNDKKLQPWLDPLNQNPMELNGRDFCVVNIDDYEILKNSVNIYPNPARDYINININNPDIKFFTIYIYDILGNLIFQSDINYNDTYKYDVSYLEKGTYIIKITTDINSISLPFITQ